jgi:hypothetical protein
LPMPHRCWQVGNEESSVPKPGPIFTTEHHQPGAWQPPHLGTEAWRENLGGHHQSPPPIAAPEISIDIATAGYATTGQEYAMVPAVCERLQVPGCKSVWTARPSHGCRIEFPRRLAGLHRPVAAILNRHSMRCIPYQNVCASGFGCYVADDFRPSRSIPEPGLLAAARAACAKAANPGHITHGRAKAWFRFQTLWYRTMMPSFINEIEFIDFSGVAARCAAAERYDNAPTSIPRPACPIPKWRSGVV